MSPHGCNSLLIWNKSIFAGEISGCLFISGQHVLEQESGRNLEVSIKLKPPHLVEHHTSYFLKLSQIAPSFCYSKYLSNSLPLYLFVYLFDVISCIFICFCLFTLIKLKFGDFPGGPVVKNLSSNAGDAGSIPGWGTKIPHATGQLSPHITTTELARHNY